MTLKNRIGQFIFLIILTFGSSQKTFSQCFQIESILVNACGGQEGLNEMVRFRTGTSNFNVNTLSVTWPNNPWVGLVQNGTTAAKVSQLNGDIIDAGGCGELIEPTGGIIPPDSPVILVTSFNMDVNLNSFGALAHNTYIIFQDNPANGTGHFANSGSGTRTLSMTAGPCSDTVTYSLSSIENVDGATVNYDPAGNATYINNGCSAPVEPFTVNAGPPTASGCPGATISLNGSAEGYESVSWTSTSGTFSAPASLSTNYTITAPAGSIETLTLTATTSCQGVPIEIHDTITLTVTSGTAPTFNISDSYCNGAAVPALPTTSTNGVTGTWDPPAIDNTISGTYEFNPAPGQCASVFTLDVTINNNVAPTFNIPTTFCSGAIVPALPTASLNAVTGTWSPAAISNTTSGAYLFTPAAGQCATPFTLNVSITTPTAPTFAIGTTYCSGDTVPALPTTSSNAITGTWSPAAISNTASGAYVFTPTAGQCASPFTLNVTITNPTAPTFTIGTTYCTGGTVPALPATSTNAITGTWSPAAISNTASGAYVFTPTAGQCASPFTLNVTITNSITPIFAIGTTYCTGGTVPALPATSTNTITGTWSPAAISNTASGAYVFTPDAGQCAGPFTLNVTITNSITPAFAISTVFCTGSTVPALPATSTNAITGTWSPATISNTTSGAYVFTPDAGQCAGPFTLNVTITNSIMPTFAIGTTYCSGDTVPALPATSTNAITGTWSPAAISNTTGGAYVFTPTAGQCATPFTLNVTITTPTAPAFAIGTIYCTGSTVPALPATSANAITGTWSPAAISNTTSGAYVFTPDAGQCASPFTLNVTITNSITPTFAIGAVYCTGGTVPALPATSTNAITGTWSPAAISNTTSGAYVFTPDAGQCAGPFTLNVTITNSITPIFAIGTTYCSTDTIPVLPTTSVNAITGTWSPAVISSSTSGAYVFTPDAGQCAGPFTLNVTINNSVMPTFAIGTTYCSGDTVPALPATSTNAIAGTWSPAAISNTTSGAYLFTPNAGQCAIPFTLNVTITNGTIPTFAIGTTYCSGDAVPALPATSANAITGIWSPAAISNTTSGAYLFTPNAGQCAGTFTLNVTINNRITPTFAIGTTYCSGDAVPALPTTSTNAITGTWSPAAISNTISGAYLFTPAAGQCAGTFTLNVTINNSITPTFAIGTTYCTGGTVPALPATSTNGITGTWSPAAISNAANGTYVFTPNAGQCANNFTLNVALESLGFGIDDNCVNGKYVLSLVPLTGSFDNADYKWTDGQGNTVGNDSSINITDLLNSTAIQETFPITYTLTVSTPGGCEIPVEKTIGGAICKIPRGISPDNNNENDNFDLTGYDVKHISIFNRYGTEVYQYDNYTNQWKGQSNSGEELPDATYFYLIQKSNGESVSGWVYVNRRS